MKRAAKWLVPVGCVVVLFSIFPPIAIRSRERVEIARAASQFSPRDFVERFWSDQLARSHGRADDVVAVLAELSRDPNQACKRYGRTTGIGGACLFYLKGIGNVVGATADEIQLSVTEGNTKADIVIPLGFVFGNAVRDGTGLLEPGAFPNAQQFNDVAAGLNHIVEAQVLPELQDIAKIGSRISFVGCAELAVDVERPIPLRLIPVSVKCEA